MDRKYLIYDEFLRIQAENSFGIESALYRRFGEWQQAKTVIDFGCGNGAYLHKLAGNYPKKSFIGIEIDEQLAKFAISSRRAENVTVLHSSYGEGILSSKFDFLILRFVASYLPDREGFWQWVSENANEECGVLVIDADDENFYVEPIMPTFHREVLRFYDRVESGGGVRDLRSLLPEELAKIGFHEKHSQRIVVSSELPGRREAMHLYLSLGTEYETGSPMPEAIQHELTDWAIDRESFAQYGIFGQLFCRSNSSD